MITLQLCSGCVPWRSRRLPLDKPCSAVHMHTHEAARRIPAGVPLPPMTQDAGHGQARVQAQAPRMSTVDVAELALGRFNGFVNHVHGGKLRMSS